MRKLAVFALLFLPLSAAFLLADYDLSTGSSLPLHSTRRYDPFGAAALREYAEESGRDAVILERPIPDGGGALLSIPDPERSVISGKRSRRLRSWIEKGNRLVVLSRAMPPGIDLGVDVKFVGGGGADNSPLIPQAQGDYHRFFPWGLDDLVEAPFRNGDEEGTLVLLEPGRLDPESIPEGARIHAQDDAGVVAFETALGAGMLAFVADPTPAQNFAVARGDNLRFLLSLLGPDVVYFDEFSSGLGREETVMDWLRRAGLAPFILQASLALSLLAWSARGGKRPSAPTGPPAPPSEAQIPVLASLYAKNLAGADVVRKTTAELARRGAPVPGQPPITGKRDAELWAIPRLDETGT
ncbi:MAG: DUF4350 domain-containing protein [Planctomycetota bacterium]|jgi:hypothetical protein|nr:DUF4350 domain-containing protein [Planctomycetota bacterium]